MKHVLKSKTNWSQVPFVLVVFGALSEPHVRSLVCEHGQLLMAAQVIVTIVARNWRSNTKIRG